jgi:predicted permease
MHAFWDDLRHGVRRLAQSRGFTLVAILTLALTIGANTAIFQLLDAVRLRPLPVESPEQLAEIRIADMQGARGNFSIWHAGATNAIWEQIRQRQHAFSGVFAWSGGGLVGLSSNPDDPRFASTLLVSGEFFQTLGVRPLLGRVLTPDDDQRGCSAPGVVLSHAFWMKEFGGDAAAVGRKLELGRYPYTIVGVTPENFTGLEVGRRFDVAAPLCAEWLPPGSSSRLDSGTDWWLIVMGRLKPGWDVEKASAHLAAISPAVFEASLPANYPPDNIAQYRAYKLKADLAPAGVSLLREHYADSLWFLQATAALVMLIGCANLANLMLARAAARERELTVRAALGAGRGRLLRLLLAESLLLSLGGGVTGVWMADSLSAFLLDFINGESGSWFLAVHLDGRLFGFAALIAIATCALFGVAPALRGARVPPGAVLRAGGRGLTEHHGRFGLRRILAGSQVGLSLVLLTAALLFARTLGNLMTQDLGLRPEGLTIAYVDFSRLNLPPERRAAFRREMMRQIEATPGVISAAETSVIPLSGAATTNDVWTDGPSAQRAESFFAWVGGGYFRTVSAPLLAGRTLDDDRDTLQTTPVAVVNEAFAARFFAGQNPVGRRFWREATPNFPVTAFEIVGLVKNAKYQSLRQEMRPTAYLAGSQYPRPPAFAQLLVRTAMPSQAAVATLKDAFRRVGPAIVPTFGDYQTMLADSLLREQLVAGLASFFGLLAALLATIGLYGLISFAAAQRTKEIGIRMALGADRAGIVRMILREAGGLAAAGLAVGGALTLALGRWVETLVYGLEPNDPATLLAAATLLATAVLGGAVIPARRAATADPMEALRME